MDVFLLFKKLFQEKDELVGRWETTNEGGFQIVMGSVLELNADGTGCTESWGHGADEPYEYKQEILWERVATNVIKIKDKEDPDFTLVQYAMEDYTGAYDLKYSKLYELNYYLKQQGLIGFWGIPQELFRRK